MKAYDALLKLEAARYKAGAGLGWNRYIQGLMVRMRLVGVGLGLKENWEGLIGGSEVLYDSGGEDNNL